MNDPKIDPDLVISDLKLIYIKLREGKAENGDEQSNSFNIRD